MALFTQRLLRWYRANARDLPWRRSHDPYRIWVSEIMLQQTRAQAVIPYYEKFLARFPDVRALARACEAEVLACWSGLGYYSRARNLQAAARRIAAAGVFPRDYESIRALPGVGPYTAAAIASIAFDLPHAVLDGNVSRVIARIRNDGGDTGSAAVRERFRAAVQELLDRRRPGEFNQAMMELGATVCLPRAPLCVSCPVAGFCAARQAGTANELPVKLRRTQPVELARTVVVAERNGRLLLAQRAPGSARMAGFWELPDADRLDGAMRGHTAAGSFRHSITHHRYTFTVVRAAAVRAPRGFRWIPVEFLGRMPLTTVTRKALRLCGMAAVEKL